MAEINPDTNWDSVYNTQTRELEQEMDLAERDTQLSPQANMFLENTRNTSKNTILSANDRGEFGQTYSPLADNFTPTTDRRATFRESVTPIDEAYEELNSGELAPRYEDILVGSNNEERLARQQGAGEVWGRGLKRFGTQLATATVGNLASIPIGIAEWINTGNFEATYDNGFTQMLDDIDRRGQLNNNIYYSQAEQDSSLMSRPFTSRFWADKVLGGASFTAGMLLSEGALAALTGGGSLFTTAGRVAGRIGVKQALKNTGRTISKGLSKGNNIIGNVAKGEKIGYNVLRDAVKYRKKTESWLNTANDARFFITSAGYEAGMEARHFRKDAEEEFYGYYENLGVDPSQQEIEAFEEELDNSSNGVLMANMGLLGVSNTAMFGRMFGIGNPFKSVTKPLSQAVDRKIWGVGTKQLADGSFEAVKRNTFQKVLNPLWDGIGKPTLTEGFWEEGGQGIASNMMSEYMQSTYDPEVAKEISGYTDALYKATKDQFGTVEGQESILVGGIIGTLFGGALGGGFTASSRKAKYQETKANIETAVAKSPEKIVNALYTQENFLSQFGAASRASKLESSIEESNQNGDITEANLKSEALLLSSLQAAHTVGKDGSFTEVMKGMIEGMDSQTIMDNFGLETQEQVDAFKADKLSAINTITQDYAKHREIAETMIGRGNLPGELQGKEAALTDALAFSLSMSKSAERTGLDSIRTIKEIFEQVGNTRGAETVDALGMFAMTSDKLKERYRELNSQIEQTESRIAETTRELQREQQRPTAERNTERLQSLEDTLLELRNSQAQTSGVLNGVRETIENDYFNKLGTTGLGSIESLNNLEDSSRQAREFVDSLEGTNPEMYNRLTTAFDSLDKSVEYTKQFSSIYQGLLDPRFNTRIANNIFGKMLGKSRSLNDLTKETLGRIEATSSDQVSTQDIINAQVPISDDVYEKFKEDGEVDNQIIESIANVVYSNEPLNPRQREIYEAKKQEVDEITNQSRLDEVVRKIRNNEELTEQEQSFRDEFSQEINEVLNDPLNGQGAPITPDEVPPLSAATRQEVTNNEAGRRQTLESLEEDGSPEVEEQISSDRQRVGEIENELSQELEALQQETVQEGAPDFSEDTGGIFRALDYEGDLANKKAVAKAFQQIGNVSKKQSDYFGKERLDRIKRLTNEWAELSRSLTPTAVKQRKEEASLRGAALAEEVEQTNKEYNQFYKDQIKLGNMTSQQALRELEEIGQQDSFEYQQIEYNDLRGNAVEETTLKRQLAEFLRNNSLIQKYFKRREGSQVGLEDINTEELTEQEIKEFRELNLKRQKDSSLTKAEQSQLNTILNTLEERPLTTEENEAYTELSEKQRNKGGLTSTELNRLEDLEQKLLEYNILQGTQFEGENLLDLLRLYEQLQINIENQELNKTEHSEEDYVKIALDGEKKQLSDVDGERNGSITQNVEFAMVRFLSGVNISHLHLSDILEKVLQKHPEAVIKINGEITTDFTSHNAMSNTVAEVQLANNVIYTFSIPGKGTKRQKTGAPVKLKSKTPSRDLSTLLDFEVMSVPGQKSGYYLVYQNGQPVKSSDGVFGNSFENDSGLAYDPVEARKVSPEDTVRLVYDPTDRYNQSLGDISRTELAKQANIYVVKNGKIVSKLKSTEGVSDSDNLYEVRKKAIDEGSADVKVTTVLAGLPLLQIAEEGGKRLTPINKSDVEDQGYFIEGESNKEIPSGVSTRYVESASRRNPTKRVPYVIVKDKVSNQKVAFPVEITSTSNPVSLKQFDDTVNNDDISPAIRALEVNNLLQQNGITNIRLDNRSVLDSRAVEVARGELENTPEPIDMDKFSNTLSYEISTVVDFNNNAFTAPKYVLDLDSVEINRAGEAETTTTINKDLKDQAQDSVDNCKN